MSPREWAEEEALRFGLSKNAEIIPYIERAITAAIEEERAACAYIADSVMAEMDTESDGVDTEESNTLRSDTAEIIRNRIRARSTKK